MFISARTLGRVLVLLIVCGGIYLRVRGLVARPIWVDEAESTINALTILEHGVPVDHYQGLPIYENTLVEPWPGSKEYEFRDSSYSRGVAVYHGWLPLYAIAASEKVFGIVPDPAPRASGEPDTLKVRHGAAERLKRTWVPRVPSVVFGLIGLAALYFAGLALGGEEAALAGLLAGAFASARIEIDEQARYYAATVALSTICCLTVWRMATRRRWRDAVWCVVSLTLLFYTHTLTFAGQCVVLGLIALRELVWRRRQGSFLKFAAVGAVVAALTLPWLIATGFLSHRSVLPRAWPLLRFPSDVILYITDRPAYTALFVLSAAAILASWIILRRRWPARSVMIGASAGPITYLGLQILVAYALFLYLMPAGSLFWSRLTVSLTGPVFLLFATFMADLARTFVPRHATLAASLLFLALLACAGRLHPNHTAADNTGVWQDLNGVLDFLEKQTFAEGTRIYAAPNDHLTFSYMSGLPIQSIAPVRRTFLNEYPGPVVVLDRTPAQIESGDPLDWPRIREAARNAGDNLSPRQAARLAELCAVYLYRPGLSQRALRVLPDVGALPPYAIEAVNRQAALARQREDEVAAYIRTIPIYRGYKIRQLDEEWPVFFYRFVDPVRRGGAHANFAGRMRNSTAVVIENSTWVAFLSLSPSGAGRSESEAPLSDTP
jgi:MFS family permease